jgi:hypothetical protein
MKRILRIGGFLVAIAAPAVQAQVINFHNGYQYANGFGGGPPLYGSVPYSGQGAYADPGNNVWNAFGGGFVPTSGGFSPGDNGHTIDPTRQPSGTIRNSDGSLSGVNLTVLYGFDNGGLNGTGATFQGTPNYILGQQAGVNSGSPGVGTSGAPMGSFSLSGVASGTYDLYLYGANFDGDRGALFSLAGANGGVFQGGINGTINNGNNGTFVLGANYVIVHGVVADGTGHINGSWTPNPASTLTGEGCFNGLQLIAVPEPSAMALFGLGMGSFLFIRRRK